MERIFVKAFIFIFHANFTLLIHFLHHFFEKQIYSGLYPETQFEINSNDFSGNHFFGTVLHGIRCIGPVDMHKPIYFSPFGFSMQNGMHDSFFNFTIIIGFCKVHQMGSIFRKCLVVYQTG